jgi:hypothetical protein
MYKVSVIEQISQIINPIFDMSHKETCKKKSCTHKIYLCNLENTMYIEGSASLEQAPINLWSLILSW